MPIPDELHRLEANLIQAQAEYISYVNANWPQAPPEPEPEPEPEPGNTARERMGMYAGFGNKAPENLQQMQLYLGRPLRYVGNNQDQKVEGAASSIQANFVPADSIRQYADRVPSLTPVTSIQLAFTNPANSGKPDGQGKERRAVKRELLQRTITGNNDTIYVRCFANMLTADFGHYVLRLGSEGDIPWPPHSFVPMDDDPKGNDDAYRSAYQRVHGMAKAAFGNIVKFSYTCTSFAGQQPMICADGKTRTKLEAGYPGDEYVDYIGVDLYMGQEPLARYDERAKLALDFAKKHGKALSFDEWGITPAGLTQPAEKQIEFVRWFHAFVDRLPATGPGALGHHSLFAEWAEANFFDDWLPVVRNEVKRLFGA